MTVKLESEMTVEFVQVSNSQYPHSIDRNSDTFDLTTCHHHIRHICYSEIYNDGLVLAA